MLRRVVLASGLAACLVAFGGCCIPGAEKVREAARRAERVNDFKQLALTYLNYHDAKAKAPENWDELHAFANGMSPDEAAVVSKLRGQGVAVAWGGNLSEIGRDRGLSRTIMAYEPQAPASGGIVAYFDGSVMIATAEEAREGIAPPQK